MITSDFGILDVKWGRHALEKRLRDRVRVFPYGPEIKVIIEATFHDLPWGGDDGISKEFSFTVDKVREAKDG